MYTCLWNEPLYVPVKVVFAEFEWKYHYFWNRKTGEFDLNIFLLNYWNDLVLGAVEIYILEAGAYLSLKPATSGISQVRSCWIWVKKSLFSNIKTSECGLEKSRLNYWNGLVLDAVETFFLEVGTYVILKPAIIGVWQACFFSIWVKISVIQI